MMDKLINFLMVEIKQGYDEPYFTQIPLFSTNDVIYHGIINR